MSPLTDFSLTDLLLLLGLYLLLQVRHGLVVRLGDGALMVAQDGHSAVRPVVRQHLQGEITVK